MYYEREWKPEASKNEIRKAKKEYEQILKDFPLTYEELTPVALEYAKRIEPIMEGNWFSEFVTIFCKEDNEPEDERIARLCGNYLRHVVLDYDETIDDLYENFWAGVVKEYLEHGEDAARKWLQTEGRNNLKELNKCIVETATAIESEKG